MSDTEIPELPVDRTTPSKCIHIARNELEPIATVRVEPSKSFAPEAGTQRMQVCGLCWGWFCAVTRFGLPVRR